MANACGFHLYQNFVISEIVVDGDLLVAEWGPGLMDQQCFRNHGRECSNPILRVWQVVFQYKLEMFENLIEGVVFVFRRMDIGVIGGWVDNPPNDKSVLRSVL